MTGIIITGTLCWKRFERSSAGAWTVSRLSWMFRLSPSIPWNRLLVASAQILLKKYEVTKGHLIIDDYDNHRSKNTPQIHGTHKVRNKKGGGFVNAQNIVLLILVTPIITIAVGFSFYQPDPVMRAWRKEDRRLRKKGIPKSKRPKEPKKDPAYPIKKEIAVTLLRKFKYRFHGIKVKSIVADSAYISKEMRTNCKRIYPKSQFLSQLRFNQKVWCTRRGKISLKEYFESMSTKTELFKFRGGLEKTIIYASARLYVNSHKKIYHIVAFKYEGEERFRFIAASELTWHTKDIIRTYAWRWLVEVEIEDIQLFCGYGQLSMQRGEVGACRGVILSFLLSHFLLWHPLQWNLYRAHQPLATVGSLKNRLQLESFKQSIRQAFESPDPKKFFKKWVGKMEKLVELRSSRKHMNGHEIQEVRGSPSLERKFRFAA